jgi:hypothetical protein
MSSTGKSVAIQRLGDPREERAVFQRRHRPTGLLHMVGDSARQGRKRQERQLFFQ